MVPSERVDPLSQPCFAGVDLLPPADKADDDAPICMPVHHSDQEFGFRQVEVNATALVAHEFGSLLARPSTLGFVKNHDVLNGRIEIAQRFVCCTPRSCAVRGSISNEASSSRTP
jgi:hypothetical protein